MKKNSTLICRVMLCALSTFPLISFSQFTPGLPAAFGIDGDVISGQSQNISGNTPLGSFDWFKTSVNNATVGIGVIDTTATNAYALQIAGGQNVVFTKGMAFPRYSSQNSYLLLDARYARDNFGYSNAAGQSDLSSYTIGSKNGDNPTTWSTKPNGSAVSDKADIIDTYIHMRRNGTVINNTNPSPLILNLGVSTVANTGNRFVDFELFRSRIAYNTSTGVFSNSGPAATGGHSIWSFNTNGNVTNVGDMTVSFSYSTSGVDEIGVYIWVAHTNYLNANPSHFQFVANEYYGTLNGYGYAKIKPLSVNAFKAWGSVSSANTSAPAWGTNSKSIGSAPNNYFSNQYAANDFGEVAIDLTSMGIDPALSIGMDPCAPPFTRIITKSRSSVSFTSSLQDFSGPYEFLDAPQPSSQIATPGILNCNVTSTTLSPVAPISGAVYQWTTPNGNIISNPNAESILVDKQGKYYLTSAIVSGCTSIIDSTIVMGDYLQPVASASTVGLLVPNYPLITVLLVGGNANLSNVITPFGGSSGLDWNWNGPSGFTAITKDANTSQPGSYRLILTEQRNGCKDTATVETAMSVVLPVKYLSFDAAVNDEKVLLNWVTNGEINNSHFEIERSFSGNNFKTIGLVLGAMHVTSENKTYHYKDNSAELQGHTYVYYRLKQFDINGNYSYSVVLAVKFHSLPNDKAVMTVSPNPVVEKITVRFNALNHGVAEMKVLNISGQTIVVKKSNIIKGYNNLNIDGFTKFNAGAYIIQLSMNGELIQSQRIIKN